MPDAVTLGEVLIDFVSLDEEVPLANLPRFAGAAGGAPANVAVGLARLGVSTGFIGKVGEDPFGDFLRTTLEEAGVDTRCLRLARGARTTLAFIVSHGDGRKDITFYRNPGADQLLLPEEASRDYLCSARLFHFGSVSLSRSPAREATLHAARVAREAGLFISYDPNWRPSLWEDPVEGKGQLWFPMPLAHVVHCAEEEWEFITGTQDLEAGARKIMEAGPELVVVTQGAGGCYWDNGDSRGQVPGFTVEVEDSLGAGDAFVAAMLSQLISEPRDRKVPDARLREIMTYANAAGALTCTRPGVIPSLPRAREVEQFLGSAPAAG